MNLDDILDYFYEVACAIEDKQEEYITEKGLKDRTKKQIQELMLGEEEIIELLPNGQTISDCAEQRKTAKAIFDKMNDKLK